MENLTCDWSQKWAKYSPEKIAFQQLDATTAPVTYREWHQRSCGVAAYLRDELGLQKGDRVAVLSTFCDEFLYLFGAAQKMGILLVPLNYRLSTRELAFLLTDSESAVCFFSEDFEPLLPEETCQKLPIALLGGKSAPTFQNASIADSDPIFLLYTSGTTGQPKGALYTHNMMRWNSFNTALRLQVNSADSTLMVMPPFHTGGWHVLTTPLLHFGATVYFLSKFEANVVVQHLTNQGISLFMAVPTMVRMLTEAAAFEKVALPHLRYFIVGGEPLPLSLIDAWAAKGVPIRQGYGLTEAGPNITSLSERDAVRKRGSIGFMNFYIQHQLVNEKGQPVAPGEQGELWLKGDVVCPGYWKNPEMTAKSFSNGWFKTGDILREDDEGFLYVVDRIKNMYISGGENVYPAEVERFLGTHTGISEVAVIGIPDEKWGESGHAFVVKETGVEMGENEVLSYAKSGLAKFKVPKRVTFLAALPKNDTGKIDRKALRDMQP